MMRAVSAGQVVVLFVMALFCACTGERGAPIGDAPALPTASSLAAPLIQRYSGAWEYRYGDSPRDRVGYVFAHPTDAATAGWLATATLHTPPGRNGARYLWLRTRLDGPLLTDPVMFITNIDQSFEAYLDDQLIDRFGPMQGDSYPGLPKVFLRLGTAYQGKTLALRIYSPYQNIGPFLEPRLGEHHAVYSWMVRTGLPPLIAGAVQVLLGLFALGVFTLRRKEPTALYYAGFAIAAGVHVTARSFVRDLLWNAGPLWTYLELGSLAISSASWCLLVGAVFASGFLSTVARRIGHALLVTLGLGAILVAAGGLHIQLTRVPLQLGVLLTAVWAIATMVPILRRGGPEALILGIGSTLACALVLFEVLMLLGLLPRWWTTLSPYSAMLFVGSFGVFLASVFLRRQRQLLQLELQQGLANRRLGEQGALLAAAARMAKGDLQSPITVSNNGELAPLESALEGMRQDLQAQIRRLDNMQQDLQTKVTELQTRNREVQQLNEELRRQIEQRSRRLLEMLLPKDSLPPSSTALVDGSLLGESYRIVRCLGRGGMGVVYEVERTTDGCRLAAKVLGSNPDRTARERFAREAQILARLNHPNLIAIFDIDVTSQGLLYIVMELVAGGSLWQLRDRFGQPDARWGFTVLRQVAAALAALHGQRIVHRDLKPENILIQRVDTDADAVPVVKLADFGISILTAEPTPDVNADAVTTEFAPSARLALAITEQQARGSDPLRRPLTQTGHIIGTPLYMAPELYQGSRNAQPSADLFSFGVLAFEILTGELPFSRPAIMVRALDMTIPAPVLSSWRPDLPPAVATLITRCLSAEPTARPDAADIAAALVAYA